MPDKKIWLILAGTLVIIAGIVIWGIRDNHPSPVNDDPQATIYFYGSECPHCKDVQAFIDANHITEKVSFVKKEVWHDQTNAAELERRATTCNIKPEEVGVPFIFAAGKCLIGGPDVIGFFKNKAGL